MILDNADDMDVFYPKQSHMNDRATIAPTPLADHTPQSCNESILITPQNRDTVARLAGGHRSIEEILAFSEDHMCRSFIY